MNKKIKTLKNTFLGITVGLLSVLVGERYLQNSQLFMPKEYKYIKTIVNRLAKTNELGDRAITFTIIPGKYVEWYAEDLKLCDEDKCHFYSSLDPFKKFKGEKAYEINDAMRQAYLFDNVQGYSKSNGTIRISRSTFRVLEDRKDFLACTIAHELDHFLTNDVFENSLKESQEGRNLEKEERDLVAARISRESELDASNAASRMIFKAGYPLETCIEETKFLYRISGDGAETKPDDSHLGYEDMIAAMEDHLEAIKRNPAEQIESKSRGDWKYKRDLNVLIYNPVVKQK